jgi:uncharacterized protein YbjT (DUF2867 family)
MIVRSQHGSGRDWAIAVFGGHGHTGRFVVSELVRRGVTPIAVGRNGTKLAECGFVKSCDRGRKAAIEEPGSLDRAFEGAAE